MVNISKGTIFNHESLQQGLFYIWEKILNIATNWCISSQYAPNEIILIHQIFKADRPKVYYSDARHQFYIEPPWLLLTLLLYFQKIPNATINWKINVPIFYLLMTVNVPIFYQTSSVTPSKVYYNNTRHQFHVNWALLSLTPILHLRKNS